MGKQINISIPKNWFIQLERLARMLSVEEDKTITHIDLIRDALKEKYNLTDDNNEEKQL